MSITITSSALQFSEFVYEGVGVTFRLRRSSLARCRIKYIFRHKLHLYWYIFPTGQHWAVKMTFMIPLTRGCVPTPFVAANDGQSESLILFTCLSNFPFQCFKIFHDTIYCVSSWYWFRKSGASKFILDKW